MQERHDNDEIESYNHEYPLLYKEAEIPTSSLGKFLECQKCYILLVTCALVIYLICMPSALGPAALRLRAYISGKSLMPMLQLVHTITITRKMTELRKFTNCSYAPITTVMRIVIRDNYTMVHACMCVIPSQLRMCVLAFFLIPITLLCMVGNLIV